MTQNAMQQRSDPLAPLKRTYQNPGAANAQMSWAAENAHLVSPAAAVGNLPAGCAVALSVVQVSSGDTDTYKTDGGKRGLSKHVLNQLGHALGIRWDFEASGRMDDGSDPHYCRWRAVGSYRSFDGQVIPIVGNKELDLRDGSPPAATMTDKMLQQQRLHIQANAETKAQLRAIRSLGLKTSYTVEELRRPFVAARIMFTGETKDPELRRYFAERTADAFLGGQQALYGRQALPAQSAAAPTSEKPVAKLPPPPVGQSAADPEDLGDGPPPPYTMDAPPNTATPTPAPNAPTLPQDSGASGFTIPGGRSKGTPLEEATTKDLEYWAGVFQQDIDSGKSRNQGRDQQRLAAFHAELALRGQQEEQY